MSIDNPQSTRELIERLYGINAFFVATAKVTGGAGSIVSGAPLASHRANLFILNLSANVLYALPMGAPSATNGIRLDPNGGRILLNFKDDLELCTYEWNIFDAVGGSNYLIGETLLVEPLQG